MTTLPPEPNDQQQPVPPVPPQPETAPQYQQPQAAPQYQQPQQPAGYQQPQAAPAAGSGESNLALNYWLSAFFAWIPALIFFLVNKDKGDARLTEFDKANLNFAIVRTLAGIAAVILQSLMAVIDPFILGALLGGLLVWAVTIAGLVLHIVAAVKAPAAYRDGSTTDPFPFNQPRMI